MRGLPDLKMLGLPRNVLVWDGEQLGTWLDALGLGQVVPAFLDHNIPLTLNPNPDPDPNPNPNP